MKTTATEDLPITPSAASLATAPVTGHDGTSLPARLKTFLASPGPYASVYIATKPGLESVANTSRRGQALTETLRDQGAPEAAAAAIGRELLIPPPLDTAATAVLAAADGTFFTEYGLEPPHVDLARVDALPYLAPILEWHQRRVPHLLVAVDHHGADIMSFPTDGSSELSSQLGPPQSALPRTAEIAAAIAAQLVIVVGEPQPAAILAAALAEALPTTCRVVTEPASDTEDMVDAAVRHVSDTVARRTVGYLRELRFLTSHDGAVDGIEATIKTLRDGSAEVLLVHDDPLDDRRVWIGDGANQLGLEQEHGMHSRARLVDAAIRSAILQDLFTYIIPSTGPDGPNDDTAVLTRRTAFVAKAIHVPRAVAD